MPKKVEDAADDLQRVFDGFKFRYPTEDQAEYVLKYAAYLLAAVREPNQ